MVASGFDTFGLDLISGVRPAGGVVFNVLPVLK